MVLYHIVEYTIGGQNMLFDTHAHYDDEQFNEDRDNLLLTLTNNGVESIVNVGASIASSLNTIELVEKYPFIYGAIGVHPSESSELNNEKIAWLKEKSQHDKIVAIGEIGLDYYWDEPQRTVQKHWFEVQMELAKEVNLPLIIHSRDAAKDTYEMMKSSRVEDIGGVIHCFSYSKEMAKSFLDMGFYLGIGGVVTFKNSTKLKEVVEYAPLNRLVLETDCPYLAPTPFRGKRNHSALLPYVVDEISNIKNISREVVVEETTKNAKMLYHL